MENLPQTKHELVEQLHQSWTALEEMLRRLSDEQMTGPRDQVGWSIKDHLDHLSVWEEGIAALLERKPRFAAMGLPFATSESSNEDEENAIIREHTRSRTLFETRTAMRASREHLERALSSLTDADLLKPYSYYQPSDPRPDADQPVMRWIVGNSSGHCLEHLPWMLAIAS